MCIEEMTRRGGVDVLWGAVSLEAQGVDVGGAERKLGSGLCTG